MAGTKVDEPLDVEFDDIDPDAKPEPDLKTDPNDEPKTEPKSEPKADPKPAGGGGDPKTATPAPDAPTPDTPRILPPTPQADCWRADRQRARLPEGRTGQDQDRAVAGRKGLPEGTVERHAAGRGERRRREGCS